MISIYTDLKITAKKDNAITIVNKLHIVFITDMEDRVVLSLSNGQTLTCFREDYTIEEIL